MPIIHEPDAGELITGEAVALDVRATSFILRGAGAAIDFVAYFGLYIVSALFLGAAGFGSVDQAMMAAVSIAGLVVVLFVIPMLVEILSGGRSLGKLAIGARIVRDDGGAIALRHAFVRSLIGVLELYMTLGGIAAVSGLLSSKGKRLGDVLAGTYSQHERVQKPIRPIYGVPSELSAWAEIADVARLPEPLARRIAQFFENAHALVPASRLRLASELADEAAPFVSPLPPAPPELFLAAVATIRREREAEALRLQAERLAMLSPTLAARPHAFPTR